MEVIRNVFTAVFANVIYFSPAILLAILMILFVSVSAAGLYRSYIRWTERRDHDNPG